MSINNDNNIQATTLALFFDGSIFFDFRKTTMIRELSSIFLFSNRLSGEYTPICISTFRALSTAPDH
jgi:hypothetical protein